MKSSELTGVVNAALESGAFELNGEKFVLSDLFPVGGDGVFSIIKPRESVREYVSLIERVDPTHVVELGIAYGGSTAFLALAAKPSVLLSFEISAERIALLDRLVERHGLSANVHLRYGVDQRDSSAIAQGVEECFGTAPIDLVIDDASHQYEPTIMSFNTLFPYLRDGGVFVIEDWRCDHATAALIVAASRQADSPFHPWAKKLLAGNYDKTPSGQRPLASVPAELLGAPAWKGGVNRRLQCRKSPRTFCDARPKASAA